VFLSYASQDAEAAQRICNALRAAGVEVWFDQSELRGGDAWDAEDPPADQELLPVCADDLGEYPVTRKEGYFRREWNLAVARTLDMAGSIAFLLPVVIDGTPDSQALVPEKFREVQWTRLPGGRSAEAFVENVRRLLSPNATTPAATSVGSSALPTSSTGAASTDRCLRPPVRSCRGSWAAS
jgi:hypothetical protein